MDHIKESFRLAHKIYLDIGIGDKYLLRDQKELLDEIDALRKESQRYFEDVSAAVEREMKLRERVEELQQYWKIHDARWTQMKERLAKLREAIQYAIGPTRDVKTPMLRETLAQDDAMERGE